MQVRKICKKQNILEPKPRKTEKCQKYATFSLALFTVPSTWQWFLDE